MILHIILEAVLIVKLVMLILFTLSLFSWAIFLKKRKILKQIKKDTESFFIFYKEAENLQQVINEAHELPQGPLQLMVESGATELRKLAGTESTTLSLSAKQKLKKHFANHGLT